jgi:heme oxygenase
MEAESYLEKLLFIYQVTRRHILEYKNNNTLTPKYFDSSKKLQNFRISIDVEHMNND